MLMFIDFFSCFTIIKFHLKKLNQNLTVLMTLENDLVSTVRILSRTPFVPHVHNPWIYVIRRPISV